MLHLLIKNNSTIKNLIITKRSALKPEFKHYNLYLIRIKSTRNVCNKYLNSLKAHLNENKFPINKTMQIAILNSYSTGKYKVYMK